MKSRFVRVSAGTIGGLKLADRSNVNPALSYAEATDVIRFGSLLRRAFGPPDLNSDADYSYTIRDTLSGVTVRAYSAQSGPAYGGEPEECFISFADDDYRLKPAVQVTLAELDAWLEQQAADRSTS